MLHVVQTTHQPTFLLNIDNRKQPCSKYLGNGHALHMIVQMSDKRTGTNSLESVQHEKLVILYLSLLSYSLYNNYLLYGISGMTNPTWNLLNMEMVKLETRKYSPY